MSARPRTDRKILPRWRTYKQTLSLGELAPLDRGHKRDWAGRTDGRVAREFEFSLNPTLAFACDLVCSASVVGPSDGSLEAAQLVLESPKSSLLARRAARRLMSWGEHNAAEGLSDLGSPAEGIRDLRSRLALSPRNALRWCDLACHFTAVGNERGAEKAMTVALSLAGEDRHVLRSAARLWVHRGRYDRAHWVLQRSRRTRADPWLVAAEIATAGVAGQRSGLVRHARQLLRSRSFAPFDTNELASALATLELDAGDDVAARRLFRIALEAPTDNSVAQAEWARDRVPSLAVEEHLLERTMSWEARARGASRAGEWRTALAEAGEWQRDQPFSSAPGELGSYEAAKGGDFLAGAEIARRALIANPTEALLLNNTAFCLLSAGELVEADHYLSRTRVDKLTVEDRAHYTATRGLQCYRSGRPEQGRELYLQAMHMTRNRETHALAAIMLAREELFAYAPHASEAIEHAKTLGGRSERPDMNLWLEQLEGGPARELESTATRPSAPPREPPAPTERTRTGGRATPPKLGWRGPRHRH